MHIPRILADLLIALAASFTVYLSVVMARRIGAVVLKDVYVRVFRCELIACAVFLLLALDLRFGLFALMPSRALRMAGSCLRVLAALAAALFLFLIGRIAAGGFRRAQASAPTALVLGLALENGRPAADLVSRLDAAEAYLRANPGATLVLTGGNPDASGRTEAAVMRDILVGRGMAEERLRLEDKAESTRANFRNTARLIDPTRPVVLISSDYHMDRAVRAARSAGFTNVLRRPAPSAPLCYGANVMWEMVLELNELTLSAAAFLRDLPQKIR